jgi:hypothetical protein
MSFTITLLMPEEIQVGDHLILSDAPGALPETAEVLRIRTESFHGDRFVVSAGPEAIDFWLAPGRLTVVAVLDRPVVGA